MAFVNMVSTVQVTNMYHNVFEIMNKPIEELRIISCHIGNGASIAPSMVVNQSIHQWGSLH